MKPNFAKEKIRHILEEVKFDGHFDKCFIAMKPNQQSDLFLWVERCKNKKENPIQSKKKNSLIGFVKKIGGNTRAILTKEKQGFFISLFLDKHKYYEEKLEKLGF